MASSQPAPNISGVGQKTREGIARDIAAKQSSGLPLQGKRVGISVSENESLAGLGYSVIHLHDLSIEIARHLLINGAQLIYGGDLRKQGFTETFAGLSYQYRSKEDTDAQHFISYVSFPSYLDLELEKELEFKKDRTTIIRVPPPPDLAGIDQSAWVPFDTPENKYTWVRSLTAMRELMTPVSDGRILAGGKLSDYRGKIPGVLEEGILSLGSNKPVYLVGAMGGAARELIRALKGEEFSFLNNAFHTSAPYLQFREYYNSHIAPAEMIDLPKTAAWCRSYGVAQLAQYNGLSVEENERLFVTPHIPEILFYIFKGLNKINKQ